MATTPAGEIKLSEERRGRLLRQVRRHYAEAERNRSSLQSARAERYRRYMADPELRPEGPWPNAARLFIPTTRDVMEHDHGQLWQTIFGSQDNVRVMGVGEEDVGKARLAERFFRWTLTDVSGFLSPRSGVTATSWTAIMDSLMDGVGVLKVYPKLAPYRPPSEDAKRYLRRTIAIDALALDTLLVPADAEGLQYPEARFVHHELPMTWDDLRRLGVRKESPYEIPDRPDRFNRGRTKDYTEKQREAAKARGETLADDEAFYTCLVESYERFQVDPKGLEEDVIVSWFPDADDEVQLARVKRLGEAFPVLDRPIRPFFPVHAWPQGRTWVGLNAPDRLRSLQNVLNRLYEQMINYGDLSMLPFFFYSAWQTGELPDLRTVMPGQGVPVVDLNGVQFAPSRSMTRHYADLIQLFQAAVERTSQVTDFNLGRQPNRGNQPRTASGTMMILQEGKRGFAPRVTHQSGQFQEALTFAFALWQYFMPSEVYAPVEDRPPEPDLPPVGVDPAAAAPLRRQILSIQGLNPKAAHGMLERLYGGNPQRQAERLLSRKVGRTDLAGMFDCVLRVDPDAQFDRQVLLALGQQMIPFLRFWPKGLREYFRRVWEVHGQTGFDQLWPEEIAEIETAAVVKMANMKLMALDAQEKQLRAQLAAAQVPVDDTGAPIAPAAPNVPPPPAQQAPVVPPQAMPLGPELGPLPTNGQPPQAPEADLVPVGA